MPLQDREGCVLIDERTVRLPKSFESLFDEYKKNWVSEENSSNIPSVITQTITEIFMGANPAFMTYVGFSIPSAQLIERFGTKSQKTMFNQKLRALKWTACLCLTEPQAGSDVSAINTIAAKQEDGTYLLTGEKILISAGMHQLTDNTIYFVMGKVNKSDSTYGLCCFIVPKFWISEKGTAEFNQITCQSLADKMGFNGCANAHLLFGKSGPCRALLLGEKENVGLIQFMTLMNQARISTGIYALGMASSAYLNSVDYARNRIQGKLFTESFNQKSQRVPIIQHYDVQKMLLEMKSKVEGCRALIARLLYYDSLAHHFLNTPSEENKNKSFYYDSLVSLLTPIVKAYTSDEAWRICELAIQVHGGQGYTRSFPVEQYARDVKVLSIWEGTNYIQSQYLIRDKLSLGRDSKIFKIYLQEAEGILHKSENQAEFQNEIREIRDSIKLLELTLQAFSEWMKKGRMLNISGYSTIFLKIMAKCTLALLHLEAATISCTQLKLKSIDEEDEKFYKGKIISARFYIWNILPTIKQESQSIVRDSIEFGTLDAFASDSRC